MRREYGKFKPMPCVMCGCLQDKLESQDDDALDMRDHQAELEGQLRDAIERNRKYQDGVYGLPQVGGVAVRPAASGLPVTHARCRSRPRSPSQPPCTHTLYTLGLLGLRPQAVEEIRQLKSALAKEEKRTRDLITELNKQAAKVEDLFDENAMLRQKLGMSDAEAVDIKGIKMQKEATLAQLRALNALLERQVGGCMAGVPACLCVYTRITLGSLAGQCVPAQLHQARCCRALATAQDRNMCLHM